MQTLSARSNARIGNGFFLATLVGFFGAGLAYGAWEAEQKGDMIQALWLGVPALPLLSLYMYVDAFRLLLVRLRFGRGELHIQADSIKRGQYLNATFELKGPLKASDLDEFHWSIVVEQNVQSKNGRNTSTTYLFETSGHSELAAGERLDRFQQSLRLPIPHNVSAACKEDRRTVVWHLRLTGERAGLDLDQEFHLPVIDETVGELAAETCTQPSDDPAEQDRLLKITGKVKHRHTAQGEQWVFPMFRYPILVGMSYLLSCIFVGMTVALAMQESYMRYFAVFTGLISIPMLLGLVKHSIIRSQVSVAHGQLTLQSGPLIRVFRKNFQLDQAHSFKKVSNTSIGNKRVITIAMQSEDEHGKRQLQKVTGYVWGEQAADILCQQLTIAACT